MFRARTHQRRKGRVLFTESLENRSLMAADVVHNFLLPHDVNDDRICTPADALVVINRLNQSAGASSSSDRLFHDVNDDSSVTPIDALLVINQLNQPQSSASAKPQASTVTGVSSGARVRVELETEGVETELNIRMDGAPVSKSFPVTLNDIALGQLVTDARGRGKLVLSQGDDNRNHLPLPSSLIPLSPDMELVIGDLVKGKLSDVTKLEDRNSTGGSTGGSSTSAQELHLRAAFNVVQGIFRSAEYEQETERGVTKRKFAAEIEKAPANTRFDVTVNGIVVGSITTDAKGKGKLRLTTQPKDARDQLMPADFPAVQEGTMVKIGTESAPLRKLA